MARSLLCLAQSLILWKAKNGKETVLTFLISEIVRLWQLLNFKLMILFITLILISRK